jgi:hypothetical protein
MSFSQATLSRLRTAFPHVTGFYTYCGFLLIATHGSAFRFYNTRGEYIGTALPNPTHELVYWGWDTPSGVVVDRKPVSFKLA